jgi:alpha-tubulin suppressor-like RCC1 family protein
MFKTIIQSAKRLGCLLTAAAVLLAVSVAPAFADDAAPASGAGATNTIAQIVGGKGFTAVLRTDGTVWTWGDNLRGKLGGGLDNRTRPTPVKGLTDVVQLATGGTHTLALKKDGTVWAWGENTFGQLGDGTTTDRSSPVQVAGLEDVTAVAAGALHSVALKKDGTVWTWGDDSYGQLGDAGSDAQTHPVQIKNLSDIKSIASGAYHSIALTKDGDLWAWGDDYYGELGYGYNHNTVNVPVMITWIRHVQSIAAGYNYSLALTDDGFAYSWGFNGSGQLGLGDLTDRTLPANFLHDVVAISAGNNHALAIKKDGTVWAWGDNTFGQTGTGFFEHMDRQIMTSPQHVFGVPEAKMVSACYNFSFLVGTDNTLWAWGHNVYGQLGDGTTTNTDLPKQITSFFEATTPAPKPGEGPTVVGSIRPVPLAAGENNSLVIKPKGAFGWGDNSLGQLGIEGALFSLAPKAASWPGGTAAVAVGGSHSLAVASDGTLWATGSNYFGQLGDGTTASRSQPAQVPGLQHVVAVAAGTNHSLALVSNGTVWSFGDNTFGQLGIDDVSPGAHPVPTAISSLRNVIAIAAGGNFSLALKSDGTVWAWGDNANGQLGDGTNVYKKQPVQVSHLTDVVAIAAGKLHAIAVKNDGTVWTWGSNAFGQLGDGTTTSRNVPEPLATIQDAKTAAAGAYHSLVLRASGKVSAWGNDTFGQLGDGGSANQLTPVLVGALDGVTSIAAGGSHSLAMKSDGTVWAWGGNFMGQLGDGTRKNRSVPAMVTGFAAPLSDIADHWAKDSIQRALEQGYVDGYEDGTFRPDRSVSRAEYVKLTAAALRLPIAAAAPQQAWYEPYAAALRQAGMLQDGDLAGNWDAPITRGEMAAVALRAVKAELQKPNTALSRAYVVQSAVQTGLLQGLAGGDPAPQAETTRAEAVTLIERMLTLKRGGTLPVDQQAVEQAAKLDTGP